jgi:hypothetical protein
VDRKQRDKLISDAEIGEAFLAWREDDCTVKMLDYLEYEAGEATKALVNIDPADTEKMRKGQNKVHIYTGMKNTILGFINRGNMAVEYLKASEEDGPTD